MAQFDVYENTNTETNELIPYILDIQNDILSSLSTRTVIPLALNKKEIKNLNPQFMINNQKVTMLTTHLSSIHLHQFGTKVCSIEENRRKIIDSIDFLITGF